MVAMYMSRHETPEVNASVWTLQFAYFLAILSGLPKDESYRMECALVLHLYFISELLPQSSTSLFFRMQFLISSLASSMSSTHVRAEVEALRMSFHYSQ